MLPGQPVSTTMPYSCMHSKPKVAWKEEKLKEQLFMQPSRLELKCRTERTVKRRLSVVNLSLEDNLPFIYAEANCSSFVLSQ